jgi:hypothetical protein
MNILEKVKAIQEQLDEHLDIVRQVNEENNNWKPDWENTPNSKTFLSLNNSTEEVTFRTYFHCQAFPKVLDYFVETV